VLGLSRDSNNARKQNASQRHDDRCFSHRIFSPSQSSHFNSLAIV
jgi:hypothetical protein